MSCGSHCASSWGLASDRAGMYPHAGFIALITGVPLAPGMASLGMQYHKLTEHFDEKPFSCEECGAKFAANSTLKNHLRLHTGDRPFMCKHCLMTFTQASALAYHTKKKHSEGKACRVSSFFLPPLAV